MKKAVIILILILLQTVVGQDLKQEVAKVGTRVITGEEFLERYELTPLFRKQIKKMELSLKLEFLYSLAAEKLWALEAEERGYGKEEAIVFSSKAFEKMFIRDELFKREIKNKVFVRDEEIIEGIIRNASILRVNFLFSEDEEEIKDLHNLLNAGIPFDSILAESPELNEQVEPVTVEFGQMEKRIEDTIYNLKMGEFTEPLLTPDGWYIFRLTEKKEKVLFTEADKGEGEKEVRKIVESRKIKDIYNNYYNEFFKGKAVDADAVLFKQLAEKLAVRLKEKEVARTKEEEPLKLNVKDIIAIETEFGKDNLDKIFIKFEDNPVILKEFIRNLIFDGFSIKSASFNNVAAQLNQRTRLFIEQELFAREGYRRGFQLLPDIQRQLTTWRDNYLFQALRNEFIDSVKITEEELKAYYEMKNRAEEIPATYNIVEILVDSAETMEFIMDEIAAGRDMKELAAVFSKREGVKERGGEFGYLTRYQYGVIGEVVSSMEVGETFGPIKVEDGFSMFKLIDKKEPVVTPPASFERVREELNRELATKKLKKKMDQFTASLADKYGMEFNGELLKEIPVTEINAFGFRNLGFGGKITAAPLLAPNNSWVDEWLKNRELNQ
jgi:parvulin-like peptidyl-prolyl isomerase